MTPLERAELDRLLLGVTPPVWTPQHRRTCDRRPGCACPQVRAYGSEADLIGYGGAAGGGKTDLILGLAGASDHQHSVIFRRVFPSLRGMIERSREIFNSENTAHAKDSFNEQLHVWRLASGKTVEFGAVQYEQDRKKWQGQPHDLVAFDEVTEFPESVVRFLLGWNRSAAGLRCQGLLTFNPPLDDAGSWVVRFFAPWLDPEHPRPAQDGELRWYAMVDGREVERPDGAPFLDAEGKEVVPKSRTFFHASLADNPILEASGYGATIDALPEPLRSILKGSFSAGRTANPFQVIPGDWVRAAQRRWQEQAEAEHGQISALGADISRGGDDQTVISVVRGSWFDPLRKYPGSAVPDGPTAAGLVLAALQDKNVPVGVDIIGYGASCYDSLRGAGVNVSGINFSESVDVTDRSGRLRMRNVRAAAYWKMREALDPESNSALCLPPDPEFLADLCAPQWSLERGSGKIVIEAKDDIIARLGRSPDCGDAAVLAWWTAGEAGPWFWEF